ncbi:MAG TPA: universal stress protein [Nitrososphaerales archaeon]|nr:universal stress protein [Nitrososphaerales archaeon]
MSETSSPLPRKILVAVEGSEPSLKESSIKAATYTLWMAAVTGAEVVGVCIVQIPEYIEEGTKAILRAELFSKSKQTLEEIELLAKQQGVRFSSKAAETSGAISSAICNMAEEEGIDLIVLGTRANTSSLTKMMLGSVASGVASNAICPVLVVR